MGTGKETKLCGNVGDEFFCHLCQVQKDKILHLLLYSYNEEVHVSGINNCCTSSLPKQSCPS